MRRKLFKADIASGTGVQGRQYFHFPAIRILNLGQAFACLERQLQGFAQSRLHALFNHYPIDDYVNIMLTFLVQLDLFIQVAHHFIHHHTHKTLLPQGFQLNLMFAFAFLNDGSQHLHLGTLRQLHQMLHHLVHGLRADLVSTDMTMLLPNAGIEHSQVVVNLGNRSHRGTGIVAGGLLFYGNSGRQTFDIIHLGLFQLAQKLPRIGRKGFYIAALTLCIEGVKSQRRFSRAAHAGENHQLISRDLQIYVF